MLGCLFVVCFVFRKKYQFLFLNFTAMNFGISHESVTSHVLYRVIILYITFPISDTSFEKPPPHPRRNIKNIPQNHPFRFLQNYLPLFYPIFVKNMRPFYDHRIRSIMMRNV